MQALAGAIVLVEPKDAEKAMAQSESEVCIFYKHSPICDLSEMAIHEMRRYAENLPKGVALYYVDVIGSRKASQKIEALTGIVHESPQVLFVKQGKCFWHASHRRITAEALQTIPLSVHP
jgi:bacillithiol system protein YtxJ